MNRAEPKHTLTPGGREIFVMILRGFGVCAIAGLTGLSHVAGAQAGDTQSSSSATGRGEPTFPEYATVEELLRLDAQAALLAARRSVTNPLDERRPPDAVPQGNALLAIFGTGRALNAEVQIGARLYTYRSGARRAVAGGASPYVLDKIDPPCVHLSQGLQKEVLCLSRARP
ncbi:MAG: hypothetical protein IT507_12250 [Burkholderiaceae bacterium]|nr:hypothetical protein [Burkholderiaceae bacterium]